jgi:predicted small secreted protein
MKKTFKVLGIIALLALIAFSMAACDDDGGGGGNTAGTFVVTDIPADFNGKYVAFTAEKYNLILIGCQSVNMATGTVTLVQISNGKASIPMWKYNEYTGFVSRYEGNDAFTQQDNNALAIYNGATMESESLAVIRFISVTFSNGGSTKSANDGFLSRE